MNQTEPASDRERIVETAWRDQAVWSRAADRLKAELTAWRGRAAIAGVAGAFLQTLAASPLLKAVERWWWLRPSIALAGAIILAVVPYVLRTKVTKERVKDWVRARSTSEALKEVIYRYLVGVRPFGPASSPGELVARCGKIKKKVEDLNLHAASVEPPQKTRPRALSVDEYVEARVNDQVERYYLPKGHGKALAAKRLHALEFWLGVLALVMGSLASAAAATGCAQLSMVGPWVAVATTAGATVTAHLAASRCDHEAIVYFGTADRLTALRDRWASDPNRSDPARIARFVDDCEHAISTENEAWLAKWIRDQS